MSDSVSLFLVSRKINDPGNSLWRDDACRIALYIFSRLFLSIVGTLVYDTGRKMLVGHLLSCSERTYHI